MKKHVLACIAALLVACTATPPGKHFIGTWEPVKGGKDTITVEQQGEGLVLVRPLFSIDGSQMSESRIPAKVEEGVLVTTQLVGIIYNEKSDTITLGATELRRKK
ncbi:hypothetical protein ACFFGH_09125 [Lysobacter korlensis]|uniref:Lipoprotein n=1 Tax=Lysobacter korlensis TaxID=553636 RepID=A0ABV6RLZ2_9GAMM